MPRHHFPTLLGHAGGHRRSQGHEPRAGRANHCETRAASPPPTPYTSCAARVVSKDGARHYRRGNTTCFDGTSRPPRNYHRRWRANLPCGIRCGMAAQRLAHKLPTRHPKPIKTPRFARRRRSRLMGGLGGWLTNATRAVAGRIRTEERFDGYARCARRPLATDTTSPTLPTPRGQHRRDPTATTPRRTGQPP
jgi:hypothetical protein